MKVSIFSEGNMYLNTFKPLVESFISKRFKIIYYTLDPKDKIKEIKSKYLKFKYLGPKFISFLRFPLIESDILISTTPNIGSKGYPFKRPKLVKNLAHVFHSISDISIYRKGSLDHYDSVLLVGEFQKESIRFLERKRNLKPKKLISIGVPYIDSLIKEVKKERRSNKTILIGSSWGEKGCLRNYGSDFIKQLAEKKYNIIVRPHPHSMIYEKDFIIRIKGEFEKYENIIWDETINPSRSMNNADLLISDTSSIRFDFLFVHEKPVITLDVKSNQMQGFERAFLNKNWTDTISFDLGPVLTKDTISKLDTEINNLFENFKPSEIYKLREKTILNFGKGADSITNYFINAENN